MKRLLKVGSIILFVTSLFSIKPVFPQTEKELQELLYPTKKDSAIDSTLTETKNLIINPDEMVHVPAGNFIMGSEDFEIDERPVREVFIDEFWIDKYPVTNSQYARFLNQFKDFYPNRIDEIAKYIDLNNEYVKIVLQQDLYLSISDYENHPVVHVSWYGADAYAKFYDKRLPTEAEWEKAARGIDGKLYPWGNEIDSSRANYWDSKDPFNDNTSPVGFYNGQMYEGFQTQNSHSSFGAYDMVGNVREWVADWYLRNYYSNSRNIDPQGPENGSQKVVRGGGFLFHKKELRATLRYSLEPDNTRQFIGFRCASSVNPKIK
ncbi:hypothetical protein B6I21_04345 [candidate division KSB1 bacterium 4572_119]|nr:MAG: hypothetical protein B6I21_04345 [candidate division KSB1 bacterium 4572_119]